jgi:hypothetical protein
MPRTLFRRANPTRRNGMPDWRSNGLPAGFSVVSTQVGQCEDSLDLYLEFTEGAIKPTRVQVRARKSADASEEHAQFDAAISRWVSTPAVNPSIQGSILGLNPSETWDIRWRITFDDGDVRDYLWESKSTIAARSIPDTDTLTPTRYIGPGGSDVADGLTYATRWLTLQKAITSAPSGAIVAFDDGYYESTADSGAGTNERNTPITLIPRSGQKWIGDNGADLANGHRAIVEPPARTSPTGSGLTNAGVWTLETLSGPGNNGNTPGASYQLWKWTGSPITSATFVTATYRTNRADDPLRLHVHLRNTTPQLTSAAAFAEYLYTNLRYRFGCWVDATGDIYARIPPTNPAVTSDDGGTGQDPNGLYLTVSTSNQTGVSLKNGINSRVSGLGFYGFGRGVFSSAANATVDHCFFGANFHPTRTDGTDPYVIHNRIVDSNMANDPPTFRDIDWNAIKDNGLGADNVELTAKICGASEGNISVNASQRLRFANNYVRSQFNGVGAVASENTTQRFNGWGTTVKDNVFLLLPDDPLEPEQVGMCWKVTGNRIEKCITAVSTGPLDGGPLYFWCNQVYQNGAGYVGRKLDGTTGASGKVFSKFSSESEPQATIYALHNTFYQDYINPSSSVGPIFAGDSAGGTTSSGTKVHEKHYWYGNFIITSYRIMDEINEQSAAEWYDDYNFYFTYDKVTPSGIKVGGVHYTNASASLRMANYRTAKNQGLHSNLVGATTYELNDAIGGTTSEDFFEAQLVDGPGGNLALVALSPLRDIVPPCPVTARLGQSFYNAGYQPL